MAKTKEKNRKRGLGALTVVDPSTGEEREVNSRYAFLLTRGRPMAIKTAEELESRIIDYLLGLGMWSLPTKSGLAFSLGIHRDTLQEYEKNAEYSVILKHYYSIFEDAWSQQLGRPNATGTIFYLKNTYGFVDRHETDSTGRVIHYIIPPAIAAKHSIPITQVDKNDYAEVPEKNDARDNEESPRLPVAQPEQDGQGAPDAPRESTDATEGTHVPENQLEEEDSALPDASR